MKIRPLAAELFDQIFYSSLMRKSPKTIRWGIMFKMYLTETEQDVAQCVNLNKDTVKRHWRFPHCIKLL